MKKPIKSPELEKLIEEVTEYKEMMQSDLHIISKGTAISKVTVLRMMANYISDLEEIITKYEKEC